VLALDVLPQQLHTPSCVPFECERRPGDSTRKDHGPILLPTWPYLCLSPPWTQPIGFSLLHQQVCAGGRRELSRPAALSSVFACHDLYTSFWLPALVDLHVPACTSIPPLLLSFSPSLLLSFSPSLLLSFSPSLLLSFSPSLLLSSICAPLLYHIHILTDWTRWVCVVLLVGIKNSSEKLLHEGGSVEPCRVQRDCMLNLTSVTVQASLLEIQKMLRYKFVSYIGQLVLQ
jgi:hypothetical protein